MLAMDGNNVEECQHLRKKTMEFADNMRTGFLSKNDAWYALNSTIMKMLEYPMEATTITEEEWNKIMAPILLSGLPRSGIDRKFPRAVLYGPRNLQGFGILHPWFHQEIKHLITCVQHSLLSTITRSLITATTEQIRLELGMPGYITDHNFDIAYSYLTTSWIKDVFAFCYKYGIKLQDSAAKLELVRYNDSFLMENFVRHGFRDRALKMLNEMRMFLKVITVANITTADGVEITPEAWQGIPNEVTGSLYEWRRATRKLTKEYCTLWQEALKRITRG